MSCVDVNVNGPSALHDDAISNYASSDESAPRLTAADREEIARSSLDFDYSLELDKVLQNIVDLAIQIIPTAERAVFHLFNEKENILRPVSVSGQLELGKPSLAMHPGEGVAGQAFVSRKAINLADVHQDQRYLSADREQVFRSLLVVPVVEKNKQIGTISVQSQQASAFSEVDEAILTRLAKRSIDIIANARLYEQERSERLWAEALAEAMSALTRSLDLEIVLDTILQQVLRVVPAQAADIMLIRDGSAVMVRCLSKSGQGETQPQVRLPLTVPAFSQMIATGQAVIIPDVTKQPGWLDIPESTWIRSYAGVPLKEGERVVGFLNVDSEQVNSFDSDMVRWLQAFASQASIALYNARLYRDLKNALAQEQLLRNQMIYTEHLVSMGRMVSLLAHALNNPLQALLNCLYLAQQDLPADSSVQEYLTLAHKDVQRLSELVTQFRRVYQPGMSTHKQPVTLVSALESMRQLIQPRFDENRIKWHQEDVPETLKVQFVPTQLIQVFLNISINALEAMKDGGGDYHITWKVAPDGKMIGVTFRDSGRGIPRMNQFDDISVLAQATPTEQLAVVILELQRIRYAAVDLDVPECLLDLQNAQLNFMNAVIATMTNFLRGAQGETLQNQINTTRNLRTIYEAELGKQLGYEYHTPTPLPTLTATPVTPTSTPAVVTVTTQKDIYVLAGPDLSYPRLGVFLTGQQANVIGRTEYYEWIQIELWDSPTHQGWVPYQEVMVSGNIFSVPVVTITPTLQP